MENKRMEEWTGDWEDEGIYGWTDGQRIDEWVRGWRRGWKT